MFKFARMVTPPNRPPVVPGDMAIVRLKPISNLIIT
jgi:hypothetical protein